MADLRGGRFAYIAGSMFAYVPCTQARALRLRSALIAATICARSAHGFCTQTGAPLEKHLRMCRPSAVICRRPAHGTDGVMGKATAYVKSQALVV